MLFIDKMKSLSLIKPKRGQIESLTPAIVTLVVAIMVLVLGVVILQEIRDTDVLAKAVSRSFNNETVVAVTGAGVALLANTFPANNCAIDVVTNATEVTVVPASNYTLAGCIISATGGDFNNTDWNVSYSSTSGGEAFVSGNASLVGLADFSDFIPIIVIAVAASIIIGLILVGFALKRETR